MGSDPKKEIEKYTNSLQSFGGIYVIQLRMHFSLIQSGLFARELIPLKAHPSNIPTALWSLQMSDVSYQILLF